MKAIAAAAAVSEKTVYLAFATRRRCCGRSSNTPSKRRGAHAAAGAPNGARSSLDRCDEVSPASPRERSLCRRRSSARADRSSRTATSCSHARQLRARPQVPPGRARPGVSEEPTPLCPGRRRSVFLRLTRPRRAAVARALAATLEDKTAARSAHPMASTPPTGARPQAERDRLRRRARDRARLDRAGLLARARHRDRRRDRRRPGAGGAAGVFVPMFFIAAAFYYMNRADQDCGTTFSWVTRALGPWPGWMGGWAICTTGILVVGSLADVAARYFFILIGADGAADSKAAVTVLAVGDHRADDAGLRARHRPLRPAPELADRRAGRRAAAVRRRGDRQGGRGRRAGGLARRPSCPGCPRSRSTSRARSSPACSPACSSTGAGRAPSTSPRRSRTPPARRARRRSSRR